jgi:hypothetical protein
MKTNINIKAIFIILVLAVFCASTLALTKAEALEPKLLWEKELKAKLHEATLATESADVIIAKGKNEIVVFDKNGNETFHWGPRIDRHCGGVSISKDGKYFTFNSGYTWKYAEEKKISAYSDDRIHFYSGETKKELWNIRGSETVSRIFPDGSGFITVFPTLEIVNSDKQIIYVYPKQVHGVSTKISPESNYFAAVTDRRHPLILFKRDGTILWERGRHNYVASISEGASYITTVPYVLSRYGSSDAENTHKGTVYDKAGNKVMEGFAIVSGNGKRLVMRYPDRISIYSLPDKKLIKDLPIKIELPRVSNPFFAAFSYDGNYLTIRDGDSIHVHDLGKGESEVISVPGMGKFTLARLTSDGRYLFVYPRTRANKLFMYQLY